jgi:hypothetical protein
MLQLPNERNERSRAPGELGVLGRLPGAADISDGDRAAGLSEPELIVGIPGENSGAGAIQVLSISAYSTVFQYWHQDISLILGMAEANDRFGSSLVVGDFNRNGYPDVAIGAYGENTNAGAVNVLFGANYGISNVGNQLFMQGLSGMLDTAENYDYFGRL